ncbi:MurNAc-LAA domain-containing protein [Candidatus Hydrogenisulfobacillus filiaventi]|uniref:MurNAc-LAA domain-containing protein n=1 Tax=Candidatus Hydrogenisulfobacillus filiaventi TaxID=2707344 RepID=A0A6F8ZIU2_9FIRM|nr:MurNAc-LAA domain-containing protein [Candidatus Hydrogenisulfobacillus filiaventi]
MGQRDRGRTPRTLVWGAAVLLSGALVLAAGKPGRRVDSLALAAPTPLPGDLLAGKRFVIDPGHGGFDPGALGRVSREDTINLAMAHALGRWLTAAGAEVVYTWSQPGDIPSRKKFRVQDRVQFINRTGAVALIDIHCNSSGAAWRGPQTFYWDRRSSALLAEDVQSELQHLTGTRREVSRIDQYVLRHARMPAINVEVGFITNPAEERQLLDPAYQRRLTWAILVGIERWALRGRWPESLLQQPPPRDLLRR